MNISFLGIFLFGVQHNSFVFCKKRRLIYENAFMLNV